MQVLFGFFGWPGHIELIIIAAIVLLLFGNRLPSVMRSMGRSIVEFKKGIAGIEDDIEEAGKETKKKQVEEDKQDEPSEK